MQIDALEEGEQLTGAAALDAFRRLIQMLELWGLDGATVPWRTWETYPLSGAALYTWGPLGDWDADPPQEVVSAWLNDAAGNTYPLRLAQPSEWAPLGVHYTEARPTTIFFEQSWPQWQARFEALPYDPTVSFVVLRQIVPWTAVSAAALVQSVDLPPGYELALVYNLAVHLAPMFNLTLPQATAALAQNTKASIQRHNWRPLHARVEHALQQRGGRMDYDIASGPGWPTA